MAPIEIPVEIRRDERLEESGLRKLIQDILVLKSEALRLLNGQISEVKGKQEAIDIERYQGECTRKRERTH